VPWFFVVSGYFLAKHCHEKQWWKSAVCKRIKTLIVPFFIWNTIAIVASGCFSLEEFIVGLGLSPIKYPALNATWYIRSLMLLVVVSPIICKCVKTTVWLRGVFFLGVFCLMLIIGRDSNIFKIGFSLEGLFYFSIGMALCIMTGFRLSPVVSFIIFLFGCVAVILLLFLRIPEWGVTLLLPFLIVSIFLITPSYRFPEILTKSSFPIYILHGLVYGVMKRLGISFDSGFILGILRFLVCIIICVIAAELFRRILPRVYTIAFGGR
jgi:fucose 4-O-acetylase-like acetyltransferase